MSYQVPYIKETVPLSEALHELDACEKARNFCDQSGYVVADFPKAYNDLRLIHEMGSRCLIFNSHRSCDSHRPCDWIGWLCRALNDNYDDVPCIHIWRGNLPEVQKALPRITDTLWSLVSNDNGSE